ncbi:hypothetical protein D3C85_159820 [compost metagenome]
MQSMPIQRSGFHKAAPKKARSKTTAYYLFDKDYQVLFNLDHASFRARNKTLNVSIVSDGSPDDMSRLTGEMIPTGGTIMEIVDLFADGASISFSKHSVAADVYKRIVDHLEFHLREMRTNIVYIAPPPEDFQIMSEFATVIRPWAKEHNPDIDSMVVSSTMRSALPVRASFSYGMHAAEVEAGTAPAEVPKSMSTMDTIERYLEKLEHGSRS